MRASECRNVALPEGVDRRDSGQHEDEEPTLSHARNARTSPTKIVLDESEMPTQWYNLVPDLPSPPPPVLHPGTLAPVGPDDLAPLFPMELIGQEVTEQRYVDIPGAVLDVYRLWRPSPLYRAYRLEKALGTPARIYYKYEGVSPAGSHKPNTAVPQAYYNAQAGIRRLTTETGAGQWGTALAFACAQFGLDCEVWQVRASYDQKPYRRMMIETFGATIHPSPSDLTRAGRQILAEHPDSTGSLGIAISEAVEVAAANVDTNYALGSVLNHVLMHQTIIGEEALLQLAKVGEQVDLIVGCTGGGSNFAGLMFPFLREKLAGRMSPQIRAVEPAACPSLTRGTYAYDFGDTAGMTPLMKMHTLGHDFVPDPIHAGGLRYHGMSPLISHLYDQRLIDAVAKPQRECFAAGVQFARTEGILPAPEPTHALAAAIEEALRCKESGEEKVILTALCGHGHLDLPAYDAYLSGAMVDHELDASAVARAVAHLPAVPVG
jgi:tryptophan synthase beta chain